ncbi:unnamed protein product [Owenia fusiformis]|uniref:Uncharacterized protein n=1 Tax=Owenia fusiformis TaxID=6347 RepID=A0A8S4PDE7_OWEFU|nr:unnamed protein product [Owenia fusiformis]
MSLGIVQRAANPTQADEGYNYQTGRGLLNSAYKKCPPVDDPLKDKLCPDGVTCVRGKGLCPGSMCNFKRYDFYCERSHQCVKTSEVCDGWNDCQYWEDEEKCRYPAIKQQNRDYEDSNTQSSHKNNNNNQDSSGSTRPSIKSEYAALAALLLVVALIVYTVCRYKFDPRMRREFRTAWNKSFPGCPIKTDLPVDNETTNDNSDFDSTTSDERDMPARSSSYRTAAVAYNHHPPSAHIVDVHQATIETNGTEPISKAQNDSPTLDQSTEQNQTQSITQNTSSLTDTESIHDNGTSSDANEMPIPVNNTGDRMAPPILDLNASGVEDLPPSYDAVVSNPNTYHVRGVGTMYADTQMRVEK